MSAEFEYRVSTSGCGSRFEAYVYQGPAGASRMYGWCVATAEGFVTRDHARAWGRAKIKELKANDAQR